MVSDRCGGKETGVDALLERAETKAGSIARVSRVGAEERESDFSRRERVQRSGGTRGAVQSLGGYLVRVASTIDLGEGANV